MTKEKILKSIDNMTSNKVIEAWNDCVDEKGYDNKIYDNGREFLELSFNSPFDAVRAVENGHYHSNDDYVIFNGCDGLESFNFWDECPIIDTDILVNWLIENPDKAEEYITEEN